MQPSIAPKQDNSAILDSVESLLNHSGEESTFSDMYEMFESSLKQIEGRLHHIETSLSHQSDSEVQILQSIFAQQPEIAQIQITLKV